jgi:hypothetical protein
MEITWLEWMGYAASAIILISLLMSSVKRLRIINLIGSAVFAVYGIMIESIPVAVMNFGIVAINIFYLAQMYMKKEYFKVLETSSDSKYLKSFIKFYKDDIKKFTDFKKKSLKRSVLQFFVLRDMAVAGVLICSEHDKSTLKIELDFAVPQYRDFKMGRFIFKHQKELFKKKGYKSFISFAESPKHVKYLKKMGFEKLPGTEDGWVNKLA